MEDNVKKKGIDTKVAVVAGIVVLAAIAIIIAVIFSNKKTTTTHSSTIEEIEESLDIKMEEPVEANDIAYDIENNSIAKVSYTKTMSNGEVMHFVMRSSYALEEDLENLGENVEFSEQPIYMTVICKDESEVDVESYVALDKSGDMKYMKARWFDNDKYYAMVTDDLITREDFLQEVNRVIIANHES